jgi:serine/threonine-protein kinase
MGERTSSSDALGVPDGDFHRGTRIGKYEVLTQLSIGGMAELFLAFTAGPGGFRKYVVVKRILPDVRANEHFVKMFLDEARITAAFNHPNIAQVFDLGEEADGLYLSMEFISGQNLNQVTRACSNKQAVLPIAFSVAVARDVCSALHYAHHFTDPAGRAYPVIHRDVAQKNVMVTYEGVVKLLDFGIAKAKGSLGRTSAGMVKGTTGYMSPEQVRGDELDGRSDVFSVGVMLHELVTGRRLFAADTELEEMKLILEAPIPKPVDLEPMVPAALSDVVMQALARERADRFESAREFGRALERAAGKLSYDQDQRALFMRELFEKKMLAARALLEAAEDEGTAAALAMSSALAAIREDGPNAFPETPQAKAPPKKAPAAPRPPAKTPVDTTPAVHLPVAKTNVELEAPEKSAVTWLWTAGLLGFTVAAAFFAYKLIMTPGALPEAADPKGPQTLQLYQSDPPLPVYGSAVPKPAGQGNALPTTAPGPDAGEPAKPPRPQATVRAGVGALTLVTTPGCKVLRGKQLVGETPLFNAALPAGTHKLTLQASDGTTKVLSAPITAGKTTSFRLKLADLPDN